MDAPSEMLSHVLDDFSLMVSQVSDQNVEMLSQVICASSASVFHVSDSHALISSQCFTTAITAAMAAAIARIISSTGPSEMLSAVLATDMAVMIGAIFAIATISPASIATKAFMESGIAPKIVAKNLTAVVIGGRTVFNPVISASPTGTSA